MNFFRSFFAATIKLPNGKIKKYFSHWLENKGKQKQYNLANDHSTKCDSIMKRRIKICDQLVWVVPERSLQNINSPPKTISMPPGNKAAHGVSSKTAQPNKNAIGMPK